MRYGAPMAKVAEAEMLTTREAADALGVDRRRVLYLVRHGHMSPARKLHGVKGALLFAPSEVERVRPIARPAPRLRSNRA